MTDDFSGMVKLTPAEVPNTLTIAMDALLEWRSMFGTTELYVSDQASYFLSETMKQFSRKCNTRQHWTTAYVHYSNGSVEIICKQVLTLMRALTSELRWNKEDWPWLVKLVEYTINHRPQRRLQWHAPITVMTGLPADNPLNVVFHNRDGDMCSADAIDAGKLESHITGLQESLALIHKSVIEASATERRVHRACDKKCRQRPNFSVVLCLGWNTERQSHQKLFLKWRGPYRIVDITSDYVFEVENLVTEEKHQIHGDRLLFYSDSKLNVTEELKTQFAFDNARFEIANILDARESPQSGDLELLISWRGFSNAENSWEPASVIVADAPTLVRTFYRAHTGHPTASRLRVLLQA